MDCNWISSNHRVARLGAGLIATRSPMAQLVQSESKPATWVVQMPCLRRVGYVHCAKRKGTVLQIIHLPVENSTGTYCMLTMILIRLNLFRQSMKKEIICNSRAQHYKFLFSLCTKSLLFPSRPPHPFSVLSVVSVVVAAAFCNRAKGFCESETRKSILHAERSTLLPQMMKTMIVVNGDPQPALFLFLFIWKKKNTFW